ncbi:MAG: crossover junction endodeoxyribonuclease RuvC [Candidatus Pacebacteria bacterium]|nr:crossover junction endodeoxyribonuclease RuvC [Candidatus Paceibacterota bacterium]
MVILGLDPGTKRAGFGLINKEKNNISFISGGILKSSSENESEILSEISNDLEKIIKKFKPDLAAIEKLFFMKNKKTGLQVAEARGVLILTLKNNSVPFLEFSPTEIKSCLTGSGHANKKEVQKIVEIILNKKIKGVDDISDALAAAILAANYRF